jgi:zinc protease
VADLERVLEEELRKLESVGPTQEQLDRAKQQLQSSFLFGLEGNMERSTVLGSFELFYGDANLLNQEPLRYFEVTREQVQAAVAKYLKPASRSSVLVEPPVATSPTAGAN